MTHRTEFLHIKTSGELHDFCRRLSGAEWIAVDTEFLRERTYYPKFCLIQVASGPSVACIDPLALESLEPLAEILFDQNTVKVCHSGRQDWEVFYHLWQRLPGPVFDTQMAAPLIGMAEQISYAGLVAELLGVTLGKSHTRTDWSIRPLSDAQLRYAADDVIYLGPCYQALRNRLVELGRLTWLDDDFNSLLNPKLYQAAPEQAWLRIGGTQHLTGKQLTVLQALAAWRETKAREQNIPRNWVIKDEVVVDLARLGPLTANELQRLRGIDERTLKRYGEDLLRMIADSQNRPPLQATTVNRPQRPTPTPEREALLDMLGAAVRLLAARHSINPAVIASRKDLERLLDQPDDCKLLRGWRNAIAGHELLALLRGEKALLVIDGRLHVQPNQ